MATNLRPTLQLVELCDKDLMKQVNKLASHQVERQSKLGAMNRATPSQFKSLFFVCSPKVNMAREERPSLEKVLLYIQDQVKVSRYLWKFGNTNPT